MFSPTVDRLPFSVEGFQPGVELIDLALSLAPPKRKIWSYCVIIWENGLRLWSFCWYVSRRSDRWLPDNATQTRATHRQKKGHSTLHSVWAAVSCSVSSVGIHFNPNPLAKKPQSQFFIKVVLENLYYQKKLIWLVVSASICNKAQKKESNEWLFSGDDSSLIDLKRSICVAINSSRMIVLALAVVALVGWITWVHRCGTVGGCGLGRPSLCIGVDVVCRWIVFACVRVLRRAWSW